MATKVVPQAAAALKPKELEGVAVMYLHAHGPALLHTKKRPVRDLAGLKGLKVRAQGGGARVIKALGGAPVAMPMPDTYQALAKGVVDGAIHPIEATAGWKLGEVEKYCTLSTSIAPTTTFFVVMNKDRWQALPADVRQIITVLNAQWADRHGKAWDEADRKGREFFLSLPGRKIVRLTPGQDKVWKKAVEPVMSEYVERMKRRGLDGAAILASVRKAMAQAKGFAKGPMESPQAAKR
jgi:TRAP-type C4-dicarboxylate transport system substrate-binding protein